MGYHILVSLFVIAYDFWPLVTCHMMLSYVGCLLCCVWVSNECVCQVVLEFLYCRVPVWHCLRPLSSDDMMLYWVGSLLWLGTYHWRLDLKFLFLGVPICQCLQPLTPDDMPHNHDKSSLFFCPLLCYVWVYNECVCVWTDVSDCLTMWWWRIVLMCHCVCSTQQLVCEHPHCLIECPPHSVRTSADWDTS